jgi:hypothetical protein
MMSAAFPAETRPTWLNFTTLKKSNPQRF